MTPKHQKTIYLMQGEIIFSGIEMSKALGNFEKLLIDINLESIRGLSIFDQIWISGN